MSANQAWKKHVRGLVAAASNPGFKGSATAQERLAEYAQMGRVGAFQHFCANVLEKRPSKEQRIAKLSKEDTIAKLAAMLTAEGATVLGSEDDDGVGVQVVADTPKPKARKARKPAKAKTDGYVFKSGLYGRYGITPKVGKTFKSKSGNTFRVVAVAKDHIVAERA